MDNKILVQKHAIASIFVVVVNLIFCNVPSCCRKRELETEILLTWLIFAWTMYVHAYMCIGCALDIVDGLFRNIWSTSKTLSSLDFFEKSIFSAMG